MAELKDLIVNGTAKFNGRIESIEPISGSMSLYPSFVATIDSSSNRYIHIGSVNMDAEVTASVTCKIAFFESYTENIDTEIIINAKHAAGNGWSQKSINVSNAAHVDDFYIIEASSTELQLWAKLAVSDSLYVEIYRIYGSTFNLNTKNNVYTTLPDNTKTSGSNNDQLNVACGTCNTASNVASKAVVVSDECWNMRIGSLITIKFINTNTANNPTLNINNTGAYPVIYNTSEITTSQLTYAGSAGKYIAYVFTGRAFVFIGWSVDSNTVYDSATESKAGLMSAEDKKKLNGITSSADTVEYSSVITKGVKIGTITINGTPIDIYAPEDKVYSSMTGASASKAGSSGLVPAPSAGDQNKFLKADGTWGVPSNTTYSDATTTKSGLMSSSDKKKLDGITTMTGALDGADGSSGLVPAPSAGDQNKFLKADGTWGVPSNSAYFKPNGGIPKSDLSTDVQSSLSKADTAMQTNGIQSIASKPSEDGYLKIAEITTNGYGNKTILLQISTSYSTTGKTRINDGIVFINIRGENDAAKIEKFIWLDCSGLVTGTLFYARSGKTIEFYRKIVKGEYSSVSLKCLNIGNFENGISWSFKLIPVAQVTPTPLDTPIGTLVEITQNDFIANELAKKGTYSKPNGGIPKSDLSTDVQSSLTKADTALQTHQSLANYVKNSDSIVNYTPLLNYKHSMGNNDKYYYVGSISVDKTSWECFHTKAVFYDHVNNYDCAEISVIARHAGDTNTWVFAKVYVTNISKDASKSFHLIEVSSTELQLWVQISSDDFWQSTYYHLYGDKLSLTTTPTVVHDSLPDGVDHIGDCTHYGDVIGNASTVNRHSVNSDVPANAVFTDTTYNVATTSEDGLMSAEDKKKVNSITSSENYSEYYRPFSDLFRLI